MLGPVERPVAQVGAHPQLLTGLQGPLRRLENLLAVSGFGVERGLLIHPLPAVILVEAVGHPEYRFGIAHP
ncbi:hypothetical protein DNA98_04110 [Meiothermus sp. Pnk-1]|nr:hypothetical protein DNA98_04110 [Meiothermus sp. Pnk-1]